MKTPPERPKGEDRQDKSMPPEEPGTNAVEHEPDPTARPIPDGEHKYIPRSPFTHGND